MRRNCFESEPSCGERPVLLERDVIDGFAVTFLVQNLFLSFQVPQPPGIVIAAARREEFIWTMKSERSSDVDTHQQVAKNLPDG